MWELDHKESWTLKNWCFWTVVLEKTFESPLDCKEIQPVLPKGNQSWIFTGRTDAEAETPILWQSWCKELTHWKRPWCWERLKVGGEGDDRRWDGWMASLTQWTWVWVSTGSWWWTGRPGVLQSMGWLRVRHDLSDFTFTFHFHALEKEMATHSSILAWRISGTGEPGGLPSMGSHSRARLKRLSSSSSNSGSERYFLF